MTKEELAEIFKYPDPTLATLHGEDVQMENKLKVIRQFLLDKKGVDVGQIKQPYYLSSKAMMNHAYLVAKQYYTK